MRDTDKWRVYRHERRKSRWVVDPPGFDSRGAAGHGIRNPRKAVKQCRKRDNRWHEAGGRIITGYAPAKQYALEQALITRWLEKGREAKEIL